MVYIIYTLYPGYNFFTGMQNLNDRCDIKYAQSKLLYRLRNRGTHNIFFINYFIDLSIDLYRYLQSTYLSQIYDHLASQLELCIAQNLLIKIICIATLGSILTRLRSQIESLCLDLARSIQNLHVDQKLINLIYLLNNQN